MCGPSKTVLIIHALFFGISLLYGQSTYYVSPTGNDSSNGSESSPWATLQGARDNIRLLNNSGDIKVYFRTGTYTLSETVVFGSEDSGSPGRLITYAAYPGEKPVFSSLVQLNNWSVYSGNIFQCVVPLEIGHVRYLQDASEDWMQRSTSAPFSTSEPATPEEDCLECSWDLPGIWQENKMKIKPDGNFTSPNWTYADQYDLKTSQLPWHEEILPVDRWDGSWIHTKIPAQYEMRQDGDETYKVRAFLVNSIEEIDQPGEWACLNTSNGYKVYLYPKSGTNDIFVPALTELVRVDAGGDGNTWSGTPVRYLTFDGLTFTGGDFRVMENDISDISNPEKNDITTQHDWAVVDEPDAIFRVRNSSDITIKNCSFIKSGGTAIRLDRYAQHVFISNNTIAYMGRNGIVITGRGPGYGDVNKHHEIARNVISHTGMEKSAAVALMVDQSSHNHIHSNYISDTKFTALSLSSPRQLAFWSRCKGEPGYYGREFHYYDFHPDVVSSMGSTDCTNSSEPAMQFIYNYNNVVEDNAFVNVGVGDNYFINGKMAYLSAYKKNQINDFNFNYLYEDDGLERDTDVAIFNDSDQDGANQKGNMFHNINLIETAIVADAMWAENEGAPTRTLLIRGNSTLESRYAPFAEQWGAPDRSWYQEVGTIENGQGGDAAYLEDYLRSYEALCLGNMAGPTLQEVTAYQSMLANKITEFGGTVPSCGDRISCLGVEPAIPQNVMAEVDNSRCSVKLTWTASDCAANYMVQRSIDDGEWTIVNDSNEDTFQNVGLLEGNAYRFRVIAKNNGINSPPAFTDVVIFNPSCVLSSNEEVAPRLSIYPNPTSNGKITVEGGIVKSYEIVSLIGKILQYGAMEDDQISFDGQNGAYLLRLHSDEGEIQVIRFFVLR